MWCVIWVAVTFILHFVEFKCSPYGSHGHNHADQNTFNVSAFDEPLFIDTGYYHSYGDPHHNGWTRQTKAHNGVLVDGGLVNNVPHDLMHKQE